MIMSSHLLKLLFAIAISIVVVLVHRRIHSPTSHGPNAHSSSTNANEQRHRGLIFSSLANTFVTALFPPYQPEQYPLQSIDAFSFHTVCTDIGNEGCDESNTIQFVNTLNPPPNGFRYQAYGPPSLKGAFWTQQNILDNTIDVFDQIASSDLVSFAQTRHGGGVQTGELRTDREGYEYVIRPLGDHSWSTTTNALDTYLSSIDVLYLYDLVEGTLDNPLRFEIILNFKVWFDCLRLNFGKRAQPVAKIEQILITDPNSPEKLKYPGSAVWIRRNTYFSLFSTEYLVVQVVDGNGDFIEPAWSEFQLDAPVTEFPGLRPDRLFDYQRC